ncbi:MAG TPA: hypothetical protein VGD22_18375 [Sphingobacteriaceae bacterium]
MELNIRLFFLPLCLIAISSSALTSDTQNTIKRQVELAEIQNNFIKRLQGTWIHEEDKNASILVKEKRWTFNYTGERHTADDNYFIKITDQLPQFVNKNEKARFLVLTQKTNTLHYEILGLTDKSLSLMHFPSGKHHLYKKIK